MRNPDVRRIFSFSGFQETTDHGLSVVNNYVISLKNFFGLPVELINDFVDVIFFAAFATAHSDSSTATQNFKCTCAFSTIHLQLRSSSRVKRDFN